MSKRRLTMPQRDALRRIHEAWRIHQGFTFQHNTLYVLVRDGLICSCGNGGFCLTKEGRAALELEVKPDA